MAGPQYSGGPIVSTVYTTGGTSPGTDILTAVGTALLAAGWTSTPVAATDTLTFAGQPANNDTVSLDTSGAGNKTYTFKTSLTGSANEIFIDTSAANTIQNLMNAIIAGPGAGTKYGTGTTANATIGVQGTTATTLVVVYLTAGAAGNGAIVSKSSSNLSWASGTLLGGINYWLSQVTPQGLALKFGMYTEGGSFYNPGAKLHAVVGDRTLTRVHDQLLENATPPSSTQFHVIADPYQLFHFAVGAIQNQTAGYWIAAGVPFIPSLQQALPLSAATNASPIQCTTASAHGITSGDSVLVVGAVGNTAANGTWTAVVIDTLNFTLTGSTGNGTYTSNSAYVADVTSNATTAEAIWFQFTSLGSGNNFRNAINASSLDWTTFNTFVRGGDTSTDCTQLQKCLLPNSGQTPSQWSNNLYTTYEPIIGWGVSGSSIAKLIGQLWDAIEVGVTLPLEQTASIDSPAHTFMAVGVDTSANMSLMVALN